jgi:anti-repressor protein
MNELIKITEQNGKKAVNARELHAFLESRQDFSNWIKYRIVQYDFVENVDYVLLDKFIEQKGRGGHNRVEYALTVNMAKELSMVEGNEKGKQARRYFIECEERLSTLPAQLPTAQLESRLSGLERMIAELKGIVLSDSKQHLTIDEAAAFTHLSKSHLYKLTCFKKIPHWKGGGGKRVFFKMSELEAWLLNRRIKTADELESEVATRMITDNKKKSSNKYCHE